MAKLSGLSINATTGAQQSAVTIPRGTTSARTFPVIFNTAGSFTWVVPAGVTSLQVLVVGGGGAGGMQVGGGGGGGGLIYNPSYTVTPGTTLNITVGAGGIGNSSSFPGGSGGNSVLSGGASTLTAIGGGGGGSHNNNGVSTVGGSGGGGGGGVSSGIGGAAGTSGQGNAGAVGVAGNWSGGGGGGAGSAGEPAIATSGGIGGAGGQGLLYTISGTPTYYAGGGGGCSSTGSYSSGSNYRAPGGLGGGGFGGDSADAWVPPTAGIDGTGGGGGGNRDVGPVGANGGCGTVILNHVVAFTTVGTTTWTAPAGITSVELLVVAGGGGGGFQMGGGGGGGGVLYNPNFAVTPGQTYQVSVGKGGTGRTSNSDNIADSSNSVFCQNLITNGTFDSTVTSWIANGSGSHSFSSIGSRMSVSRGATGLGGGEPYQIISVTSGVTYVLSCSVGSTRMSVNIGPTLGSSSFLARNLEVVDNNYLTFTPNATGNAFVLFIPDGAGTTSTVDNVVIAPLTSSMIAVGGGQGGCNSSPFNGTPSDGRPLSGGSGGGSGESSPAGFGTPGQGFMGGIATEPPNYPSGGGGGAGGPGTSSNSNQDGGGCGGPGVPYTISGQLAWYGAGGGGGTYINGGTPGKGGIGGGGDGNGRIDSLNGSNATGFGNGGGGGGYDGSNGNGGSGSQGVVYLRFNDITGGAPSGMLRYNNETFSTELWNNGNWIVQQKGLNQGSFDNSPSPKDIGNLVFWIDPAHRVEGALDRLQDLMGQNRLIYMTSHASGTISNSARYYRNVFGGVVAAHQSLGGHIVVAPTTGFGNAEMNFTSSDNFAVVMWTYKTASDNCGSWMTVQSGVGGSGYRIWREDCGAGVDNWQIYVDDNNNNLNVTQQGTNNRYKVWKMDILQRENGVGSVYTYYGSNDYARSATWTQTGAWPLMNGTSSSLSSKDQWLHFGNSNWAAGSESAPMFMGPIYIYRKALTARERLIAFNMYKTRFGLN